MNKILSIAIACMVLFIFIRCTDKEEAPLPIPHLPTAEEIFIEKINKIKELIDSAGTLPTEETTPMKRELVSRKDNDVVYRYDEETEDYGYYTPVNFTFSQKAFEKVAELPPMKSVDVIWPGNLIQGKSVADGNLAAIPVADKRAGGEIVLNVVSGQEDMMYYRHVENMSGAGVTQAMNDMLAPYESGFPADVSYLQSSVSSIEEMSYYLDMHPEELNEKSNGAFKPVNWTTYTNKVMIKLRQVFFTISYDYRGIENVFSQNIEYNDLKAYITENNPPCYIASVSYGRYFILLYESEYSENKLYDVLRKAYSTENLEDFTPQEKKIIHKSKVYMVQVGGNPVAGLETITTDPDKIREFVIGGAVFSKDNVGAPISYKVCYLQNAVPLITYKNSMSSPRNSPISPRKRPIT